MENKEKLIKNINKEIKACRNCSLREGCIQPVPGEGDIKCDVMFIGEAPGKEEDEQARPFVGRSGKLLNAWIIKELGLQRKDVYITNICKCRPPNNRNPQPTEAETCRHFLDQQIELIKPKIIILLGAVALRSLFNNQKLGIKRCRGEWMKYNGVAVMPTYHPAFLLRQMSEMNKKAIKYDFSLVKTKLKYS